MPNLSDMPTSGPPLGLTASERLAALTALVDRADRAAFVLAEERGRRLRRQRTTARLLLLVLVLLGVGLWLTAHRSLQRIVVTAPPPVIVVEPSAPPRTDRSL